MRNYEYHLSDQSAEALQQRNQKDRRTQPESLGEQHQVPRTQMAPGSAYIPQIVKAPTHNKMSGFYKPEKVVYRNNGNVHIKSKGTRC